MAEDPFLKCERASEKKQSMAIDHMSAFLLFFPRSLQNSTSTKKTKNEKQTNKTKQKADSIHDKRYVTVGDEGGAADDLSLPGVLRVGRVELAFEEEVVDGDGGEGGEGGGGHASSASSAAAPSSVTSSASSRVGGKRSGDPGRHRALVVTDIGSEALVLVNGRPLAKRERVKLSPGNVLSFRSMGQAEEREEAGVASCCCEYELYRNEFAHA